MKKPLFLLCLSSSLIASAAGADSLLMRAFNLPWVETLSMGPIWESGGRTQTFYLTPTIEKTYTANQNTYTLFNSEVFVGIQQRLHPSMQGQLGLAVAASSNAGVSGHIWDDADSAFDNYTYRYNVQHTYVGIKGKLLADMGYWFTPWLSASIGAGFNNANGFHNTPLIEEAVENPNFASHTETAFSYTVGIGAQKTWNQHWQVGIGYEFSDWGNSQLGRAAGQTVNSGLSMNHLYTNGLLINLTHLS